MRPVVSSKLQTGLKHISNETLAPGTGTKHAAAGVLVEVYDQEKLESIALSAELQRQLKLNPGLLFAKVKMIDGVEYMLPFQEPEDQIYLTYGNGFHLEGKRVKVEWTGMNINNGHILLTRTHDQTQISIPKATNVLDIGNII